MGGKGSECIEICYESSQGTAVTDETGTMGIEGYGTNMSMGPADTADQEWQTTLGMLQQTT